jgi:hypothetical protein
MSKKRLTVSLALLLVFFLGSISLAGILKNHNPASAAVPNDVGHSGFNSAETAINPNTAGSLKLLWSISEGSTISTQPIVANSKIYWGSWDGIEHASLDSEPGYSIV